MEALGQGGARDIGLPAIRAALRAGNTTRAVEWLRWALRGYPMIETEMPRIESWPPSWSSVGTHDDAKRSDWPPRFGFGWNTASRR